MKSVIVTAVFAFTCSTALAQGTYLVNSISFAGNESFSKGELQEIMLTKESPSAFLTFTYRVIHIGDFHLGSPPVYFDPVVLQADSQRISQFYINNGFFGVRVNTALKFNDNDERVDILVRIKEGASAEVKSLVYHGIPDSSTDILDQLNEKPLVTKGARYSAMEVKAEVERVIEFLKNHGYAYAKYDSSVVNVIPIDSSENQAEVNLYFSSGNEYYWGPLSVRSSDSVEARSDRKIIVREMLFVPGDIYSDLRRRESEERIDALNLYQPARILIADRPPAIDTIDGSLSVKARPGHEVSLGPLINDDNNTFNIGGSVGYLQRNFFGDARLFTLSTNVQLESFPSRKHLAIR